MKIVAAVVQIVLGLIFFIFGLNGFFNFIHGPMPGGDAGEFLGLVMRTHYVWMVSGAQVLAGLLLLVNRFVPFALVLLAAIIVNILNFHATMNPSGLGLAIGVAILWLYLAWRYRSCFAQLLAARIPRETI